MAAVLRWGLLFYLSTSRSQRRDEEQAESRTKQVGRFDEYHTHTEHDFTLFHPWVKALQ